MDFICDDNGDWISDILTLKIIKLGRLQFELLHPKLCTLLSAPSNILCFQKRYQLLSEDPGNRQMEERVFGLVSDSPDNYPQQTRLQKSLRSSLLQGDNYGTAQGFLK